VCACVCVCVCVRGFSLRVCLIISCEQNIPQSYERILTKFSKRWGLVQGSVDYFDGDPDQDPEIFYYAAGLISLSVEGMST